MPVSCKVNKASVQNCLLFWLRLLALNTRTNKLPKFVVPILKPFTTNECTIKDNVHFPGEIVNQQPDFFMGSLDVYSLFTNIPLVEIIEICTKKPFKESETAEGLSKSEFKELLPPAT